MTREEIRETVSVHRPELRRLGVRSLALFGSAARNQAGPQSDIDFLVEVERPMGIFGLLHIQLRLQELLGGVPVDLVTRDAIIEELRDSILRDTVRVL